MGDRERIGGSLAVGHLTSATCLEPGANAGLRGDHLHADVEIAVELSGGIDPGAGTAEAGAAIGGYRAALELVDLAPALDTAVAVVATNIFHRAVAFGPRQERLGPGAQGAASVGGERRAVADAPAQLGERLLAAARVLAETGHGLSAGDLVITGSIVQVPVAPGDRVTAEVSGLGAVTLTV
jgi:2-keto-4-pentenoate hydratase